MSIELTELVKEKSETIRRLEIQIENQVMVERILIAAGIVTQEKIEEARALIRGL